MPRKQTATENRFSDLEIVSETDLTEQDKLEIEKSKELGYTEIVCILDRSGSMNSIREDAIGGFNSFLNEQKNLPGDVLMTIALFDHEFTLLYSGKDMKEVAPLDNNTYVPRGSTALLDAMGKSITELNKRNPKKAIVVVLTDGQENASTEFSKQTIKSMVDECEKKGYAVIYLSSNFDAINDARSVGVGSMQSAGFAPTSDGMTIAYSATSSAIRDYRSHGAIGMSMAQYTQRASAQLNNPNPYANTVTSPLNLQQQPHTNSGSINWSNSFGQPQTNNIPNIFGANSKKKKLSRKFR